MRNDYYLALYLDRVVKVFRIDWSYYLESRDKVDVEDLVIIG